MLSLSETCIFENVVIFNEGTTKLAAGNTEACAWLCQLEPTCAFWTFEDPEQSCVLSPSDEGKMDYPDFQSGSTACGGEIKCNCTFINHPSRELVGL